MLMSPKEIVAEMARIEQLLGGPPATVYVHVGRGDHPLSATCYMSGIASRDERRFGAVAHEWDELFENIKIAWRSYEATYVFETVRKIALEIIKITAERGECSEAAIRACRDLSPEQIDAFIDRAVDDANAIASNGPFSVIRVAGNGQQH